MNLKIISIFATVLLTFVGCDSEPSEKPVSSDNNFIQETSYIEETTQETTTEEVLEITEITSIETTSIIQQETVSSETKEEITENIIIEPTVESISEPIIEETTYKNIKKDINNELISLENLSNEKLGWYFNPNNEHKPPTASNKVDLSKYNAYYLGNTDNKVIYLTFDEGYENGYSEKILDVLKEKDVKAAFFVTKSYIKSNQELIKRMVNEGHVVGNHSVRHLSFPDLSNEEIESELVETAQYFKEVTGVDMPMVFRPPMGEYSERTLAVTSNLGYKTIFWSFAYKDWLTDQQPGKQVAYDTVMKRYHNGAIMLLHAVSKSNTEALGDIIDSLRNEGYVFDSLENL